ncbi:MATE family efflux transporter [Thermovenabulum gondwanense]|uniref:Probable multidrug resistance protein NorM n=1 Tax=Thermovenabulum gondwanense TaxID=520767 RepID=A0A162MMN2_9FIRM|nr:MATE family efflux transporter [Thermovenabulum gondwanense]KYO66728.1 Multidrug resistance protein MdtK [Thermovenabulum gondwanense]
MQDLPLKKFFKEFFKKVFNINEETYPVLKSIWNLAWPVVIEQTLAMVSQVVDMAMVGRLGATSVAAVGLSMQPFMLINSIIMGLSVGTTTFCARAKGAKNDEEAGLVLVESMIFSCILGLLLVISGFIFAEKILDFMNAEEKVKEIGAVYFRAMMPGMMFFFLFTIITAALRGVGDTKTPMIVNLQLNIIHIILNYILIFGKFGIPALGALGAGISTSISRFIGALIIFYKLKNPEGILYIEFLKLVKRFNYDLFKRIIYISVPAALERIISSAGQMQYARQVASLGTLLYAAHSISINVESFSYMPGIGFATAATALTGLKLGAKDFQGARISVSISNRMAVITMGIMGFLFFIFPVFFLRIYTDDTQIIKRAVVLLRIVAFTQIPEAISFVISGALKGAGDTRFVLYVNIVGMWIVRLSLTAVFMRYFHLSIIGAWIAMFIDWVVRSILYYYRLKSEKWQFLKI